MVGRENGLMELFSDLCTRESPCTCIQINVIKYVNRGVGKTGSFVSFCFMSVNTLKNLRGTKVDGCCTKG